jgi:hypothetical protein
MDHFPPGDWIDLARNMLSSESAAAMQAHLDQGCEECLKAWGLWRAVTALAAKEFEYRPPDEAVRVAKAAYRSTQPDGWLAQISAFARVVFDSLTQPSPAMVRAVAHTTRQLVHESEPYLIDLKLEGDPARKRIFLAGQIINSENPAQQLGVIDVVLLRGTEVIRKTQASPSGEFDLDFGIDEDLQLFINLRGQRAIGIVLPTWEN